MYTDPQTKLHYASTEEFQVDIFKIEAYKGGRSGWIILRILLTVDHIRIRLKIEELFFFNRKYDINNDFCLLFFSLLFIYINQKSDLFFF